MRKASRKQLSVGLIVGMLVLGNVCSAEAFAFQERISTSRGLAHYAMGQIYDLLGQTKKAVFEYEQSAQFDETNYLVHLRLGADYARLDMLERAKEELRLVSKYNPEELQSHYLLALIYSTEKDYDNAAQEYEYILKTFSDAEPGNIDIYGYLGQLYYSQRKYSAAISQFEKILQLEPNNPDVLYLLGSLYLETEEQGKAIELLEKSIELDPEHDGSLNTLGYIYAENDQKLDEAQTLIERALEVSPNNGAYLDSLGWVFYKKQQYDQAIETFKQADEYLKDPVIYDHMGDVYHKLSKFDEAIKYWNLSLELLPDQKDVIKKIDSAQSIQARKNTEKSIDQQ